MHDIFISYTRDDQDAAAAIADRLSASGFSVFFDRQALVSGEAWSDKIGEELRGADAVIALLSSRSRRSTWVADELQGALDSKKLVIPVLLDQGAKENWLWPLLATRQSIELNWGSSLWHSQLNVLVEALSNSLNKETFETRRDFASNMLELNETSVRPVVIATLHRFLLLIAFAIVSATVGAVITWLLIH